jgi:ligand-binding sensor domain-containing protein
VGGAAGLFQQTTSGFESVSETPVVGLVGFSDIVFVANDDGLFIWDGTLRAAALGQSVEGSPTSVARDGDDLWVATDQGLYLLSGEELSAFASLASAGLISGCGDSDDVIVALDGGLRILRSDGSAWVVVDVSDEPATTMVPAAGGRIFGEESGVLRERISVDDGVAWRPVALTTSAADGGASGVDALLADPVTGATWVAQADVISRLTGADVGTVDRPALGALTLATVTSDSALWLGDGVSLVRIGEQRVVTWDGEIAEFNANNCTRCHQTDGIGRPLETKESWVNEVDQIIDAIENERMPQDGAALVGGTADLVRQWKEGGLQ